MAASSASSRTDALYISLLGLAENFRTSNPPNIRRSIHCLKSIFNINPGPKIEMRTYLQLGNMLMSHSQNTNTAIAYLQKAINIAATLSPVDLTEEDSTVLYEAASSLAQIYQKQCDNEQAKQVLRKAVEVSHVSPHWHCRLLFQLAQLHAGDKEYGVACQLLAMGEEYSTTSEYARLLFILSKGMLLLIAKKSVEVHETLSTAGRLIETFTVGTPLQKESLKVFFLILQVCHYLIAGQVKSVKPALKNLQQIIQTITQLQSEGEPASQNPVDLFQWLPIEHMCILVYLVTVMHSMQAGYIDKAQKYTDKALIQIEKLKMLDSHPILSAFQLMLLENIIMCRLIMGNKTLAIQEIYTACTVCQQQPLLFTTHGAQIHTLLGLYAMSMNCMEAAEAQFKTATRSVEGAELTTFINLNLAIVYLRTNRTNEFTALIESSDAEEHYTQSHSLKASSFYVRGLQAFFQTRYNEAKRYLRETLKMANAEDLNRLTSCSLVLLGHIFLNIGNNAEALNMVTPAMQLAGKIPDVHVQLWASSLLKDLYGLCGDTVNEAEGYRMHASFSQSLLNDHLQSLQLHEHQLIQWTDGPCPFHLTSQQPSM